MRTGMQFKCIVALAIQVLWQEIETTTFLERNQKLQATVEHSVGKS